MAFEFPNAVAADEELARCVLEKSKIRADGTVKHNLYMPPRSMQMSVYRISDMTEPERTDLLRTYVGDVLGRPVLGYAKLPFSKLLEHDLAAVPTLLPHPRHADIVSWPREDDGRLQLIAISLAASAKFVSV